MNNNLFQQAREMMTNFMSNNQNHLETNEQDKETVRRAIQAAYNEATPEEMEQLKQFEQQLDEKIEL